MNKIKISEKKYRAVAWQRGDKLTVVPALRGAMRDAYLDKIEAIRFHVRPGDAKAFAESVEWERLGDCMLRLGDRIGAVKACLEAASCCLGGVWYDYGRRDYPCFGLRVRMCDLYDKAVACCGGDRRLRQLVASDTFLERTYRSFKRFDRLD